MSKKRERRLRWRALHPEQWKEEKRRWAQRYYAKKQAEKGKTVKHHQPKVAGTINLHRDSLKEHGITQEELDDLYQKQRGECAICLVKLKKPWTEKQPGQHIMAVDHDHKTGTVRGLLCRTCNLALGQFKDDMWRLEKAKSYLKNSQRLNRLSE